jgi:cytochrome c oxidase cbb3-type subunit 3
MRSRFARPAVVSALLALVFAGSSAWLAVTQISATSQAYAADSTADQPGVSTLGGDPAKGKMVFEKNCVPCHKQDGTGGIKLIATGNPSRNFHDAAWWKTRTDPQIQHSIETGFPKSGMVAWKGVLKPEEIKNVIAYLHFKFQPKAAAAEASAAKK